MSIFLLLVFITWVSSVFAVGEKEAYNKVLNDKNSTKEQIQAAKDAYSNSAEAAWDVTTTWFTIFVDDISPGMWPVWWTTKENVNFVLWTIIQNLMIALWSLALLIMTIWAGYILLHHGQDELLSKWKAIFMSWVYAMVVALSSYYLISIVRYILYFGNN